MGGGSGAAAFLVLKRALIFLIYSRECFTVKIISWWISMTSFPAFAAAFARLFVQSCQTSAENGELLSRLSIWEAKAKSFTA